jgi:hypothetical protein
MQMRSAKSALNIVADFRVIPAIRITAHNVRGGIRA